MNIVEKYGIKFTMKELLEIERAFDKNILDSNLQEEVFVAEKALHLFLVNEVEPFTNAVKDKKMNKKEEVRSIELQKKHNHFVNKKDMAIYRYYFELASYFTNSEIDEDDEITLEDLVEFYKEYQQGIETKFISKKKETEEDDTGLPKQKEYVGFMRMHKKSVVCLSLILTICLLVSLWII